MATIETSKQVETTCLGYTIAVKDEASWKGSHAIPHARNTGRGAKPVGTIYEFPTHVTLLGQFAGMMHDFKRSPGESADSTDEAASARIAVRFMEHLNRRQDFPTTEEERAAVSFAILNHGTFPSIWKNPETRNLVPDDLNTQVHILLFGPDKGDANGPILLARRPAFVAGERLQSPNGDLPAYGYNPNSEVDKMAVVCVEGALRTSIINPESVYPDILKPFVGPLYEVQMPFVYALCKAAGLNATEIAKLVLERTRADGKNILDVRKMDDVPRDVEGLATLFREVGGITDEGIEGANGQLVDAGVRTLSYFSDRWHDDFYQAIDEWQPEGRIETSWKRGMNQYNRGTWFNQVARNVARERREREQTI